MKFKVGDKVVREFRDYGVQEGEVVGWDDYYEVYFPGCEDPFDKGYWLCLESELTLVEPKQTLFNSNLEVGDKIKFKNNLWGEDAFTVTKKDKWGVHMESDHFGVGEWGKWASEYEIEVVSRAAEEKQEKAKPMHPDVAAQAIEDYLKDNGMGLATLVITTQEGGIYRA